MKFPNKHIMETNDQLSKSFNTAKYHYTQNWETGRKNVLQELKEIRDKVQEQARILSIGSITYSSVGVVGGGLTIAGIIAAPFTFGISLGMTVAGIATGVTSAVAGVTHGAVKFGIVKQLCEDAKISLEQHEESCDNMRNMLKMLQNEVEGENKESNNVASVIKLGTALAKIIPSEAKGVSNGAAKLSTEALSVVVAIRIVVDLGSLVWNSVDLSNFNDGKLCPEAQKLQDVIDQMESEYNDVAELFK